MTKQFFTLFLTTVAVFMAQLAIGQDNAQYDDLYFDGVEEAPSYSQRAQRNTQTTTQLRKFRSTKQRC